MVGTDTEGNSTVPCITVQSVSVKFDKSGYYEFTGVSGGIRNTGIFLYAKSPLEQRAQVEVVLTLPSETWQPILVQIRGKVLKLEESFPVGIARTFDSLVIAPEPLV
jgi:hypothetical protein